ncbi:hypothetical protein [Anseongella ginsenosidimutans]|nr:hypothetical protein [Anseongella ginsenosidimutans]QEC53991.1 hypothetical protein FRZ59_17735 [Anseongella ginsenosidimutans]
MADSLAFSKGSMRELRGKYESLPSRGFNLKSSAIFVPVLIIPYGAYYTVLIDEKRLSTISGAWESLFFPRDLQIEEDRYIKFVVPTVVTVSKPME